MIIPDGWRTGTLGELGITGEPGFASGANSRDELSGVPHIRPMNISPLGAIALTDVKFVDSMAGTKRLRPGDVLFNNTNSPKWVGKTAFVRAPGDWAFSNHMTRLSIPSGVDGAFVAAQLHAMQQNGIFQQICSNHVNQASVSTSRLLRVGIKLPPIEEQRRIVDLLEGHLSRLDAANAYVRTARSRLSALESSFAGGAVGTAVDLGQMSTVGEHARLIQYGSSAKSHGSPSADDVPVLRMGNIQDGQIDWGNLKYLPAAHADLRNLMLNRDDLLFNRTNSAELVGKAAVFDDPTPTSFASYLIRVRFDDQVLPQWAGMVINSSFGRSYIARVASQQVGQANVNGTKLRAFPLPVPDMALQVRLVAAAADLRSSGAQMRSELQSADARASLLRRALLSAAFSGQLTGHASDSDRIEELADATYDPS